MARARCCVLVLVFDLLRHWFGLKFSRGLDDLLLFEPFLFEPLLQPPLDDRLRLLAFPLIEFVGFRECDLQLLVLAPGLLYLGSSAVLLEELLVKRVEGVRALRALRLVLPGLPFFPLHLQLLVIRRGVVFSVPDLQLPFHHGLSQLLLDLPRQDEGAALSREELDCFIQVQVLV